MRTQDELSAKLFDAIVDSLDIPKSYYERAAARHKSLGDWLCRPTSSVARFEPRVSLQGSFRYGTVNRPLDANDQYDLDNVTTLELSKTEMTQRQLKELYGKEIKAYALAHDMLEPVVEMNRCWRLLYTDEVKFHLDSLPCLPEEDARIRALVARGTPQMLAEMAVAITDRRHPQYDEITHAMLSSNPSGFAAWFEDRTRPVALARIKGLVEARQYASVDQVPPYDWKTPLQRSIQILKRHRDVMFVKQPSMAPISMIITNLASHAYGGEEDIFLALRGILDRMSDHVRPTRPRVPNPADPAEDYADKWARDPSLEQHFWEWHTQAKVDIERVAGALGDKSLSREVHAAFHVNLSDEEIRAFGPRPGGGLAILTSSVPILRIPSPPRPWRDRI